MKTNYQIAQMLWWRKHRAKLKRKRYETKEGNKEKDRKQKKDST